MQVSKWSATKVLTVFHLQNKPVLCAVHIKTRNSLITSVTPDYDLSFSVGTVVGHSPSAKYLGVLLLVSGSICLYD